MKKVAPKPCFLSSGRATVKCDLQESSKGSTTSLSGIGSRACAGGVNEMQRITTERMRRIMPSSHHGDAELPFGSIAFVEEFDFTGASAVASNDSGRRRAELKLRFLDPGLAPQ